MTNRTIEETERAVLAKLGQVPLLRAQMAAVSNIHRAAAAVRQHLENSVLRGAQLTWTSFVVLWVVWIWGEMETRYVAEEAGISKGTLTGVARTLESRGLVERVGHPSDGRMVLLRLTPAGESLMAELFPRFNQEEAFVAGALSDEECEQLAGLLRRVVGTLERDGGNRRSELTADAPPPPRPGGRRRREV
ncbi:MarR family transcriptional regulator [Streptomyces sp. BE20]|uniref:MarR family winged helix-turn-helix transcriptional regulator n=1 Tax=Streptomyces sp. BE20 TaxID=3002525 RepID=UPI002E77A378|nr:MarR family transcriptional regulator [Streptomyces sp. BE20]MEE1824027.1 MarR family transcriptional regulator [Streptomyces sp. BE20]